VALTSYLCEVSVLYQIGKLPAFCHRQGHTRVPTHINPAMSLDKLPPISNLPSLPTETRADILDLLFEPSPALHTLALPLTSPSDATVGEVTDKPFDSYDDLIIAVGTQLNALADSTSTSDRKWLDSILSSHPRLGENKVDSALSRAEQAAMNAASTSSSSDKEKEVEADELRRLNKEYEETFPGLRYVVFVAGRPRKVIFEDMKARIARGDPEAERREAIKVCFYMDTVRCHSNLNSRQCVTSLMIDRRNFSSLTYELDVTLGNNADKTVMKYLVLNSLH